MAAKLLRVALALRLQKPWGHQAYEEPGVRKLLNKSSPISRNVLHLLRPPRPSETLMTNRFRNFELEKHIQFIQECKVANSTKKIKSGR